MLVLFAKLPESTADLSPWNHWRMPLVVEEVGTDLAQGPVLVTIECAVISQRIAEFVEAMHQYGRMRRRDGAYRWGSFGIRKLRIALPLLLRLTSMCPFLLVATLDTNTDE